MQMGAASFPALRISCALVSFISLIEISYGAEIAPNETTSYTGWHNGPAERGTMTILWSCLTTVFACTWTILHLNVPDPLDSQWKKFWRKTKWMGITVVFPEFAFAKAVCELQMAIQDLHGLKEQEVNFGWDVEYDRGCQLLYWLFHEFSWSRPLPVTAHTQRLTPSNTNPSRTWTLTHCYLANMGGTIGNISMRGIQVEHFPVTAHALVKCCVPNGHSPFDDEYLTKEEIFDKSKVDSLFKTAATLQILWLVVSVITRKMYNLPISLLEVCTVAFATIAIATYAANWAKPKDVEVPIELPKGVTPRKGDCMLGALHGESFFQRTLRPSQPRLAKLNHRATTSWRITNDMFRPQAQSAQYFTLTYALALSTMCFGGIHCAAWQNYFPSRTEKTLWQVASVLSSTLPIANLLVVTVLFKVLGKKANEAVSTTEFIMKSLVDRPREITPEPEQCRDSRYIRLSWIANTLYISEPPEPGPGFYLLPCIEALLELQTGVSKGRASISWCRNNHYCWKQLCNTKYLYKLDEAPRDSSNFVRLINFNGATLQRPAISDTTMSLILETINNLNGTTERLENDWELIEKWVERLSSIFTLFSGSIYVVARLVLLVLAFAAFRKQDQRLYIDTWARFLPNVG